MGLKDPQRERFAVLLGTGKRDKTSAYCETFDAKPGRRTDEAVAELLAEPDVRERVKQAQEAVLSETALSEVWLLDKLRHCIQDAYDAGKYATAISGIKLAAQHRTLQLFPQRVDHHQHHDPLADMTREELIAEAVRLRLLEPATEVEAIPAENPQ